MVPVFVKKAIFLFYSIISESLAESRTLSDFSFVITFIRFDVCFFFHH